MGRVGLLGGTFDPPHIGHLLAADQVRWRLGLFEVWLVVANDPWQKSGGRQITPAAQRLEMTQAAVGWANQHDRRRWAGDGGQQGHEQQGQGQQDGAAGWLRASDVELELGGPSYTMITLDRLRESYPRHQWVVIVGEDAASGLESWHDADRLRSHATFAVVPRSASRAREGELARMPGGFECQLVDVPSLSVSSSDLRTRIERQLPVGFLTPPPVIDLVTKWGLYRPES